MFHTYVTASSGRSVDIDRAAYVMTAALWSQAEKEVTTGMFSNGFNPFDIAVAERMGLTREYRLRLVWRGYCELHKERYGTEFEPDVSETWDA